MILFLYSPVKSLAELPGQGYKVDVLSDDFEETGWTFYYSGSNGYSSNGLWRGSYRGVTEILERIVPPAGGLNGSTGALRIRSYDNGDDNLKSQDDLVSQFYNIRFGRNLLRADQPNVAVYLYVPSYSSMLTEWATIGFRMEAWTTTSYYYPSIWVYLAYDRLYFVVRLGDGSAPDVALPNPQFSNWQGGWIKLGIVFDAQGIGRYYIKQGVGAFEPADELYTTEQFPGGTKPKLDHLYYNFFSLGYPETDTNISPDFVVDDISIYISSPSTCQEVWAAGLGQKADFNKDCKIDINDLALLTQHWLECYRPSCN